MVKSICDFNVGDFIEILSLNLFKYQKERMLSIGFTKGAIIQIIRIGPKRNLTVFDVSGAMIALRGEEAKYIYGKRI